MSQRLITLIRDIYGTTGAIPLHVPTFAGREAEFVADTIASTFVSSVGAYVDRFEADVAAYTGAERAVAVVNGTAALHIALVALGVRHGDLVLTQSLTFVGTANAIAQAGAQPVFVDVERETLGMSPEALGDWLETNATRGADGTTRLQGQRIAACIPMHTFGHPVRIGDISRICADYGIPVLEDAAEAMGSWREDRHCGTFGRLGALSFNGNKLLTTGGGGMVLANTADGQRIKHLTTTAKKPHAYEYVHDAVGYNYRLPNINAALGCAQMERLADMLAIKRKLAQTYREALSDSAFEFVSEPTGCRSNYWLNAVIAPDRDARDSLLTETNEAGIGTRPIWRLMHHLPMYADCPRGDLSQSEWLESRVVNLPSSVPPGWTP